MAGRDTNPSRLAEISQMLSAPSDAFPAGEWCLAANELMEALAAERVRREKAETALRRAKESRTGVYEDKLTAAERVEVAEKRLAAARAVLVGEGADE
jgi:SAM-dependent MidA family methyltransferase